MTENTPEHRTRTHDSDRPKQRTRRVYRTHHNPEQKVQISSRHNNPISIAGEGKAALKK